MTSSWVRIEMPAAAARLATMPPVTAPADQTAWKRVMIDRPTRRCSSTACAFIATSVSPSKAPMTMSVANTSPAVGTVPNSGRQTDITAEVVTVIVRLPRRSTHHPLIRLASKPPMPPPRSVRPSAASEMPSSACSSGNRGVHEDSDAPLTKKTAPMAAGGADGCGGHGSKAALAIRST